MVDTVKFSEFNGVDPIQPGDIVVGLRNGDNHQFSGVGSGSGSGGVSWTVTQDTSNLSDGSWVRLDVATGLYVKALADNASNGDVAGLCAEVLDGNSFTFQQSGQNTTTFSGLTPGNYFLSATVAGEMSLSPPMNDDEVSVAVFLAESATSGLVRNFRGKILGGGGGGGGTGDSDTQVTVTQVGHGFMVGEALYIDSAGHYDRAIATSFETAQVAGLVVEVTDADTFVLQQSGYTTLFSGLTAASLYWLSDTNPGEITLTKPTDTTSFLRQCFNSYTTTAGWILEQVQLEGTEDASIKVTQVGHTFNEGEFVRPSTSANGEWALALADTIENATGVWMVIDVDGDDFWIQQDGLTDKITAASGHSIGATAYLSTTTPGAATHTAPTASGDIHLPLYRLTDNSTTPQKAELLNVRPLTLPLVGTGNGEWQLLHTQVEAGGNNNFSVATIVQDNPHLNDFRIDCSDVYATSGISWFILEFYIGGVVQTAGYIGFTKNKYVASPNISPVSTSSFIIQGGTNTSGFPYVRSTLMESGVSSHYFPSLQTNGSTKHMWGDSGFYGDASAGIYAFGSFGKFAANTAPVEGFRIGMAGGTATFAGTVKIYGK